MTTSDFPKISHRALTPTQRRSLKRILRYYREHEAYTKCTSVRYELTNSKYFVSVVVTTRRSDCDKHSPRQLICGHRLHAFIYRGGRIVVADARCGLQSTERALETAKHVAYMVGGKISKRAKAA